MLKILKGIFDWCVYSSADPKKLSATLKWLTPTIMLFLGWANLSDKIPMETIHSGVLLVITVIVMIGKTIGTTGTAWFFLRKIILTVRS